MTSDIPGCIASCRVASSLNLLTLNPAHRVRLSSCDGTWVYNQALPNLCEMMTAFWWTPKFFRVGKKKKTHFLLSIHTAYQEMTGRRAWAQMHQKPWTQRSFRKACDELNCSRYYLTEHESYIKQKACLVSLTGAAEIWKMNEKPLAVEKSLH